MSDNVAPDEARAKRKADAKAERQASMLEMAETLLQKTKAEEIIAIATVCLHTDGDTTQSYVVALPQVRATINGLRQLTDHLKGELVGSVLLDLMKQALSGKE